MTNAVPVNSMVFTISPDGDVATSGNGPLTYGAWPVTGKILGVEIGSPAFDSNTGSLYVIGSNPALGERTIAQVNGLAQERTYYPIKEFQRSSNQGTLVSGIAYSEMDNPIVAGEAVGLATSGTFNGEVTAILYYL